MMTNSVATAHPDVVTAPVDRGTLPSRDDAARVAIRQRLAKAVRTCSEKLTLLREMAAGVHAVLECHSIILLQAASSGGTPRGCRVLAGGEEGFPAPLQQALGRFNPTAVVGRAVALQAVSADPGWQLVAVPLGDQPNTEILIAVVEDPLTADRVTPLVDLIATHVALWQMRFDRARRETEAQTAATLAELLGR